ncbi:acetate--CoA ligase family protein [Streptomyces sp. NPDC096311]|uniref:acetate--CoA ligase family protein n=1 Tax=Streptomyces sp. NPDC096311 TaxID=3366083 RepID=UPI00381A479B
MSDDSDWRTTWRGDLARLLTPRNVAIVGAKDASPSSYGVVEALARVGFAGRIFAVNRSATPAHGLATTSTCAAIGEPVDAAVLLVPAHAVHEVLDDVADAGARSAVLLSSGWAEAGSAGETRQRAIVARARELGVTLVGPNCLGFLNVAARTGAWIASVPPGIRPGPVAIVSQSGGMGNALADLAAEFGVGLSCVVTTGNEAMLTTTDVIEYLVEDESTRSIALFAEAIADPARFLAAADRARELGKAIIVLKAGASEIAARNAVSHTGSLVGDDRVVDAALRQCCALRVRSPEELVITAGVLATAGPLRAPGIAVVSISGGSVDVVADEAERLGLQLPEFDESATREIEAVLPAFAGVGNPLDITGAALGDEFERVLRIVDRQEEFGAVAILSNVPAYDSCKTTGIGGLLKAIGRGTEAIDLPAFLLSQTVAHLNDTGRAAVDAVGVRALPGLALGITALSHLSHWSRRLPGLAARSALAPRPAQPLAPADGVLSEWAARALLARGGVTFVPAGLARSADEAVEIASGFGGPVAVKLVSPDVPHKSDVGAVILDVTGDDAVRRAYEEVRAAGVVARDGIRVEGVQVSPMRRGGVELVAGVTRDPQWGPVLAVGLGGVFVEVLADVALRLLPVTARDVEEMLGELRGRAVLDGARGRPPVDRSALVAAICRIAGVAWQLGNELDSVEVNPLRATATGAEALDALVVFRSRRSAAEGGRHEHSAPTAPVTKEES